MIPYTAIKTHNKDIKQYLNEELGLDWVGQRGFGVANFTINAIVPSDENRK